MAAMGVGSGGQGAVPSGEARGTSGGTRPGARNILAPPSTKTTEF